MGFFQGIQCGVRRHCAAFVVAAERSKRHKLGRVGIITDAHAAITRMTHDEHGPGRSYALQQRKAVAALRVWELSVDIEIPWCPAHKEIPGNEVADGWAKQPPVSVADTC